jgi:hypothetical protein
MSDGIIPIEDLLRTGNIVLFPTMILQGYPIINRR